MGGGRSFPGTQNDLDKKKLKNLSVTLGWVQMRDRKGGVKRARKRTDGRWQRPMDTKKW